MPRTRKSHPPSLKAKVAVEAIKAHKTAAQIAQMFGVHPTQVGGWKKQALAGLPDIFGSKRWIATSAFTVRVHMPHLSMSFENRRLVANQKVPRVSRAGPVERTG